MIENKPTHHLDRRIIRTRRAIRDAFISLLTETDYDKITITALAKRADIDRKTFYTHYASIDALFEDVMRQYSEEGHAGLTFQDLINDPVSYSKKSLYTLMEVFPLEKEQRAKIFSHIPLEKFMHYATIVAREQVHESFEDLSPETKRYIDFILEFYLGAIFNAYAYWLFEQTDLTFDEAVEIISTGVAEGLHGILDLNILPASFVGDRSTSK